MISFKQFLIEIGNSSYDFEDKTYHDKSETRADFFSKSGDKYTTKVTSSRYPRKANVVFGNVDRSKDMYPSTSIEGNEKNASHRIFGTVKHIIQHHLKKNPIVTHINFAADPGGGREKLYHHFAKSIDPNYSHWKREYNKGTEFEVNVSKLRNHINEGKVLNVSTSKYSHTKVFHNPTNQQVKNQNWDGIRTLKHGNDHYVWQAYGAEHHEISHALGIPFHETEQGWFDKRDMEKASGDYKKAHETSWKHDYLPMRGGE